MKIAYDLHKSHMDRRHRAFKFEEGNHVFLRFTPTTCMGRAIKVKKITLKFIGPYYITTDGRLDCVTTHIITMYHN